MATVLLDSESIGDPARFLTLDELDAGLGALPGAPRDRGRVECVVVRSEGGARLTPERVPLTLDGGVEGDAWTSKRDPNHDAQITVMQADVARLLANGQPLALFGDNLFLDLDISDGNVPAGALLRVGTALLEVTPKPHNGCGKFRSRFGKDALQFVSRPDTRYRNMRGIHMRVLQDGEIGPGDIVEVVARGSSA